MGIVTEDIREKGKMACVSALGVRVMLISMQKKSEQKEETGPKAKCSLKVRGFTFKTFGGFACLFLIIS